MRVNIYEPMSESNIQSTQPENILKSCVFLKLEKESQVSLHQKILFEEIGIELKSYSQGFTGELFLELANTYGMPPRN